MREVNQIVARCVQQRQEVEFNFVDERYSEQAHFGKMSKSVKNSIKKDRGIAC